MTIPDCIKAGNQAEHTDHKEQYGAAVWWEHIMAAGMAIIEPVEYRALTPVWTEGE